MRKYIRTWLWAVGLIASVLVSSCYDDKGNYDYKEITRLTLAQNPNDNNYVMVGDTLRLHPQITYSRQGTPMRLSYSWKMWNQEIGTDSTLEFVVPHKGEETYQNLTFTVTDEDTGIQYQLQYTIGISTELESVGFVLLARKNGTEHLYFLPSNGYSTDGTYTVNDFKIIDSVYTKQNPGEQMPTGTFKVRENFALIDDVQRQEVLLSPNDIQFIDGSTFQLSTQYKNLASLFYQGLPAGMKVKDAQFLRYYALISDEEGHLYSRIRSTDKFFNPTGDQFLNEPVKLEGEAEPLKDIEFVPFYWGNVEHTVLWDKYKNRILMAWDMKIDNVFDGTYTYIVGKIEPITSALSVDDEWPSIEKSGCPYPKVEDLLAHYKMVHLSAYNGTSDRMRGYFLLVKDEKGDLYQYTFEMTRGWETPKYTFEKDETGKVKITWKKLGSSDAAIMQDPITKFYTFPSVSSNNGNSTYWTMVSHGRDLYVYNRASNDPRLVKVHTFDSPIVLLEVNNYQCKFGAVALEDGTLHTFSTAGLANGSYTPLYDSPKDFSFGMPLDMFYRESPSNWGINWQ